MKENRDRLLLRNLALEACERLGEGIQSESPTILLTDELKAEVASDDVAIVAYCVFLADQERYRVQTNDTSGLPLARQPADKFTYDLQRPILDTIHAVEFEELEQEQRDMRGKLEEIKTRHAAAVRYLNFGIAERRDPASLIDPQVLANPELKRELGARSATELAKKLGWKPELTGKEAQTERRKARAKVAQLEKELANLRMNHGPRLEEITNRLEQLHQAETPGVLSPALSIPGQAAWGLIAVNRQLTGDERIQKRGCDILVAAKDKPMLSGDIDGPPRSDESRPKTTRHDQKSDQPQKKRKRIMTRAAADCARIFRNQKGLALPLKTVVEDYVAKHGGSTSNIIRILNDNPEAWKDATRHDH